MRRLLVLLVSLLAVLLPATPAAAAATHQLAASQIGGGSQLYNPFGPARGCTAAFAATGPAGGYLIAGPNCGSTGTNVYSGNNVLVGPIVATTNSGATLVHVTNPVWTLVGWIGGPAPFRGHTEAPIGASVCLFGGTGTGYHCGTITARNVTVVFADGTLTGLTRTNVCAEPGDTAVTFVSNGQAQGGLIGASGSCSSGGATYFAPVTPVLAAYGLALLY